MDRDERHLIWTKLDIQMRTFSPYLRDDLQINPPQSNTVATTISEEIRSLDNQMVQEICEIDSVGIQSRLDELIAFQAWMDFAHYSPKPEIVRAQVITQNYVSFVYLGESVFKALRSKMASSTVTKKCCKFLSDNPIRAFRNAIAHANWKYKDDFSGIIFWARKGDQKDEPLAKWEVNQDDLGFWQALARCVGYVILTELQGRKKF